MEEENKSIMSQAEEDAVVESLYKDFPRCSNKFLEELKKTYDIRKLVRYSESTDYLRGVQDVLDFIEMTQKKDSE